jgi:hypothetical protein
MKEGIIEKLEQLGVYCEQSFNKEWCYKYSFPGQETVIVSNADKERSANKFFVEYLKSLHYSLRYLYEKGRPGELAAFITKMKSFKEPNIDKIIEMLERSGMKLPNK